MSETAFQAHPVAAVNSDHQMTIRISTRRGPIRSPSQPPGISKTAYAHPNTASAHAICVPDKPRSRLIDGAATAIDTRSIYVITASDTANAVTT